MRLMQVLATAALFYSPALSQWTASRYYDSASGITYASVTLPNDVTYRIALPLNSNSSDAIVQIIAPVKYGWCGLAWGGRMVNNPLSVAWPTKQTTGQVAIVSNRMASGYTTYPPPYSGASHTPVAKSPSKTNSTHWTATARCQGCTQWTDTNLDTKNGETRFAYACSLNAPSNPTSNTSALQVHESPGIWNHNLTLARNASYALWVGNGKLVL